MGIRNKVQAKVGKAFDSKLSDAVDSFTGTREVVGEYDPQTGQSSTTITYTGRGVFGSYSVQEADGQHILRTDTKLTALQNEVLLVEDGEATTTPATPIIDDRLQGMKVINVKKDPAGASWTIQLRYS